MDARAVWTKGCFEERLMCLSQILRKPLAEVGVEFILDQWERDGETCF